eukprot:402307-Pyramimonas_sp.AAC.1
MRPRGIGSRPLVPSRTTAPCNMSFQLLKERMATLADNAKENILALCDPGPQRIRDEEKRLDPLISVVMNASLGMLLVPAHPGTDLSGQPLPRPEGLRTATREIRSSSGSEPAAATDVFRGPGGDVLDWGPSEVSEGSEADVADEPEGSPATGDGHNTGTADDETSSVTGDRPPLPRMR